MDRRDPMTLSGSGSYYFQRGITGSGHPQQQQPTFHGSLGVHHHLSNQNPPFEPNTGNPSFLTSTPIPSSSHVESPAAVANVAQPPSGDKPVKRKRGRPRKYGQDGSVSLALSPSISSSISGNPKRGRGRPPGPGKKHRLPSVGELQPASSGMSFTPHVLTVSVGEDIGTKITSFSQQSPRAICILSANGAVSNATLHQPSSSPTTITYEGRFEILSLSASYMLTNDRSFCNQSGNLNISLASPDCHVIGGGVGGPLIAASPVQVIVGSFIWAGSKTKNKKQEEVVLEAVPETDDQAFDNNETSGSILPVPGQNFIQTSLGIWGGSRPIHDQHIDIDLMRG